MAQPTTTSTTPPSADIPSAAVAAAAPSPGIIPESAPGGTLDAHLGALLDDVERSVASLSPDPSPPPSGTGHQPVAPAPSAPGGTALRAVSEGATNPQPASPSPLDAALDNELNRLQSGAAALVPPDEAPAPAAPAPSPGPEARPTEAPVPSGAKSIQELDKELAANAKRLVDAAEAKPATSPPAAANTASEPTAPATQPPSALAPAASVSPAQPAASAKPDEATAPPPAGVANAPAPAVPKPESKPAPAKPGASEPARPAGAAEPAAPAPEAAPEAPAPKRTGPALLVARAISFPMAMIPPATRDLVGWAALVTLFQGLCIWAYLLIWR